MESKKVVDQDLKKSYLKALFQLQQALDSVKKNAKNPYFKSNYADLNAHLDAVMNLCETHGFILTQSCIMVNTQNGPVNAVLSKLIHVDTGIHEEASLALPSTEDMQKLGSAITYARRYTLSSLLAMQAEDDDGNKAANKNGIGKTAPKTVSPKNDF